MNEDPSEPVLIVGPLRVRVRRRQFPDAQDYWDGNWVDVVAVCTTPGATVTAEGPIVHLGEVRGFLSECEALQQELQGKATLDCVEPNLRVRMELDKLGHISVRIEITPDHMTERHRFDDMIDQTYLPAIINGCRRLLDTYPLRDPNQAASNNRMQTDGPSVGR